MDGYSQAAGAISRSSQHWARVPCHTLSVIQKPTKNMMLSVSSYESSLVFVDRIF